MTQKKFKLFINEIYGKPPKKKHDLNKTDVYHIDDIWSLDILDLKDYGPENNKCYRYIVIVIDIFIKFGWTVPLENKKAERIVDTLENILIGSKITPNLIETDREKEFCNNIFQNLLNSNKIEHYSINTDKGAVFAESFIKSMRNILKKLVFEKRDGNWTDVLPTITKQYNNRVHTSTKITTIQAGL